MNQLATSSERSTATTAQGCMLQAHISTFRVAAWFPRVSGQPKQRASVVSYDLPPEQTI
jgi:hypothetical protein